MEQQEIREYGGVQFSKVEGAALVQELNLRTVSDLDGYNSIGELGVKVKDIEENTTPTTIENPPYDNIAALLADQGNQTTAALQFVTDARDDPNFPNEPPDPIYAYYEKLATSNAHIDDYRLLSPAETIVIEGGSLKVQDQNGNEFEVPLKIVFGLGYTISLVPGGGVRVDYAKPEYHEFACSTEEDDLEEKVVYRQRLLRNFPNCTAFDFGVIDAPTGTKLQIRVYKNGTTVFSTDATIDIGEFTTLTASVPQVIIGGSVSFIAGDELKVEIITIGTTVAGVNMKAQITYNP